MTNKRICDKCKAEIKKGVDYIKLQKIIHKEKKQEYIGVGHLCQSCLDQIIAGVNL